MATILSHGTFGRRLFAGLCLFSTLSSCNPGKIDITLSPAFLSDGYVGQPYTVKFTAGGGAIPYTFAPPSQGIPPGLAFAQVTATEARLEGIPQSAGNFIFQIGVCDAFAKCVARGYLLKILPPTAQMLASGAMSSTQAVDRQIFEPGARS